MNTRRLFLTTDEQLREWSASLDKVTPGPWENESPLFPHRLVIIFRKGSSGYGEVAAAYTANDAAHIARCDPQTIGALIDEVMGWRAINHA